MFKKLSLKIKLIFLMLGLLSISLIVGGVSSYLLKDVSHNYDGIVDLSVPKLRLTYEMMLNYRRVRIELRTLGLDGLSKEAAAKSVKLVHESIDKYEEEKEAYLKYGFIPGQKEVYEKMDAAWKDFKATGIQALGHWESGKPEDLKALHEIFMVDCPQKAAVFTKAANELIDFNLTALAKRANNARDTAAMSNYIVISIIAVGFILGLLIGIKIASSLASKINKVTDELDVVTNNLSDAATSINESSTELANATTEQAASLQETASSLEELTSMVAKSSDNSKKAVNTTMESRSKANLGKNSVEKMLKSMGEISHSNDKILEQVNLSNERMQEIVSVINEIGSKTKVINEIVFQTKLLSFNASVEAARAGDQGKGFAVVAEEVGNLAQMSGNAAKEISSLLESSTQKVESIMNETKSQVERLISEGKLKVNEGIEVSNECNEILTEIVETVSNVSTMAEDISGAANEQSLGISEINKAMAQLDTVTQQNASTSEISANAAGKLTNQVEQLKKSVRTLKESIEGENNTTGNSGGQHIHFETNDGPSVKNAA